MLIQLCRDLRDHKELQVLKVQQERRALLEFKDQPVRQELREHKVQQVLRA